MHFSRFYLICFVLVCRICYGVTDVRLDAEVVALRQQWPASRRISVSPDYPDGGIEVESRYLSQADLERVSHYKRVTTLVSDDADVVDLGALSQHSLQTLCIYRSPADEGSRQCAGRIQPSRLHQSDAQR
jgi:hypothetical protein